MQQLQRLEQVPAYRAGVRDMHPFRSSPPPCLDFKVVNPRLQQLQTSCTRLQVVSLHLLDSQCIFVRLRGAGSGGEAMVEYLPLGGFRCIKSPPFSTTFSCHRYVLAIRLPLFVLLNVGLKPSG